MFVQTKDLYKATLDELVRNLQYSIYIDHHDIT